MFANIKPCSLLASTIAGWFIISLLSIPAHSQFNRPGSGSSSSSLSSDSRDASASPIDEETKKKFAKAQPEDINNENFPELIDSFDYPDADIAEVVKAISKLTGKNFIIDPAASRGKITILAPTQITVAEAYRAFLSALAINNLTVVPSGNFLKIRQVVTAQNDSIETYTDYFPNTDQVITRIVKLKYISAEDLASKIKYLKSRQGILEAYGPTNSLIITDFGSNIERISRILAQLDVPGFEEQLTVIRIYNAKAKEIRDLIDKIINKGESGGKNVPRFRRSQKKTSTSGAESYSLVVADERTNSIVVMGNTAGIKRIKALVKKLDFPLNPEDSGGVFVYYVRHGEAEKIANVLNGVATDSKKANDAKTGGTGVTPRPRRTAPKTDTSSSSGNALFGGDVKITADEATNSLVITASRQDYDVVKGLLAKIDIRRDQVFIKAVIMEMLAEKKSKWGVNYFKFKEGTDGLGRVGYVGTPSDLTSLLSPLGGAGAILGFGIGKKVEITPSEGAQPVEVKSITGLINLLKSNNGGNVLSSPQIMVMDNEEANIEVGQTIPVGQTQNATATGTSTGVTREKATINLKITPRISPDTDEVQMEIDQKIKQATKAQVAATALANASVVTNDRNIETSIIVDSGDTAVIGGLMQDTEDETITKVPILGDIPIVGWLFKSKEVEKTKRNLMMFITPKIIRNIDDNAEIVNQKINERIDFIQSFMNGRDPHGYEVDNFPRKRTSRSVSPLEELDQDLEPDQEEPAIESF